MRDHAVTDIDRLQLTDADAQVALEMDEDAFRGFYDNTCRPLWAYLARVSRDRQVADDLLQETYYRFLKSRRGFDNDDHRRRYLFRIATNLVLDRRRRTPAVAADLSAAANATTLHANDDAVICRTDLSAAMGRLKPRERALLWLAYAEGASHDEIATVTGLRLSSVKQLLFRARRRLARLMGGTR